MNRLLHALVATAFAAIAMTFVALPVQAQSRDQAIKDCDQERDPDRRISGCTQLIKSGTLSARQQSFAYNSRGNAWRDKDDNERAIPTTTRRSGSIDLAILIWAGAAQPGLGEFDRALAITTRRSAWIAILYLSRPHNVLTDRRVRPRHRGRAKRSTSIEVCGSRQTRRHLEPEGRVRPRATRPTTSPCPQEPVPLQPWSDLAAARRSGAFTRRSQPGASVGAGPRAGAGLSR